jgi:hypothetical protein
VLAHKDRGLDAVFSDEEWGRQCVAGVNPSTIQALKVLPATLGSAIGPQHVDGEQLALLLRLVAAGGLTSFKHSPPGAMGAECLRLCAAACSS